MGIFRDIFGSKGGSSNEEIQLSYSLGTREGRDKLMKDFLKIKKIKSLNELPNKQFIRIFGRPKSQVIETYLSGIGGNENYCVAMAIIAYKLREKHGELEEIRCFEGPKIELQYADHHIIHIAEQSGNLNLTLIKYGYEGTGPDCFYTFINENGFQITKEEIKKIKPPFILSSFAKGQFLFEQNDFHGALSYFKKSVASNSENKDYIIHLGLTLYKLGEFTECLPLFEKATIIDPKYAWAYYLKGLTLFQLGKYMESLAEFEKAISIIPDYENAWIYKGLSLFELKNFSLAYEALSTAQKINPTNDVALEKREAILSCLIDKWVETGEVYRIISGYNNGTLNEKVTHTALIKIGSQAVNPLLANIRDADTERFAVHTIEQIGFPAIDGLIVALANDQSNIRNAAAKLLGKFQDSRAINPLVTALDDKEWIVRRSAAEALGLIGDTRSILPLTHKLDDQEKLVRDVARTALYTLGWKPEQQ